MRNSFQIKLITNHKDYPYDLLLADETIHAIDKYLYESMVYVVYEMVKPIAVFCLYPVNTETLELKTSPYHQSFKAWASEVNFLILSRRTTSNTRT
jgi:aminoglycoside 6'-N-acetyltransferase I